MATFTEHRSAYTIDQQGIDRRWRVWWINSQGLTVERLFDSREEAERYADEMATLEATH
jgi:hypothetical protein